MEIALVTGARPQFAGELAIVRLAAGRWRIRTQFLSDSVIKLRSLSSPLPLELIISEGFEVLNSEPITVQCFFVHKGTEQFINIWAENVNGNRHPDDAPEVA